MSFKVKAIREGYYKDQYRYVGAEFIIENEKLFSENWMEKVGQEKKMNLDGLPKINKKQIKSEDEVL